MVVFFYAPWCGHCKQAKPDIVQVSNELLDYNNPIPYVAIDAEGSKSLASLYGISSFPTWKVWIKGELIDSKEAFGDSGPPRGTTDMLTFMMQLHDPSWKPETSDEDEQPSKKKKKSEKKKNKAEVIGKQLLNGAKKGSLEEVEAAINAGADIEEKSKDEYTALIYATAKGHANVVVYLIEEGANVNAVDKYGTSALEYASKKGHEKIFTMLIDAGAMEGNRDGDEDDKEEEKEL
jgi:ankyrin repeat protein